MALDAQGALDVLNPLGSISMDGNSINSQITDATGNPNLSDFDPTKTAQVDDFTAPALTPGQQFEGQYNPTGGASQTLATEKALGIQGFNGDAYTKALEGGLRARVNEGVKAERSATGNRMANSGFLNSGTAEALDRESIGRGERTFAMGAGDIAQDSAGKLLQENAQRMGYSLDNAKTTLSNDQFTAGFNEQQRVGDNAQAYGGALDQYQLNELDPALREDAMKAGVISGVTGIVGDTVGAVGTALPMIAAACRMAEATYGINHPLTNKARYRVNLVWPMWAKALYMQHMVAGAELIQRNRIAKAIAKPIFWLIGLGSKQMAVNGKVL